MQGKVHHFFKKGKVGETRLCMYISFSSKSMIVTYMFIFLKKIKEPFTQRFFFSLLREKQSLHYNKKKKTYPDYFVPNQFYNDKCIP
jgi:hypothetical protein